MTVQTLLLYQLIISLWIFNIIQGHGSTEYRIFIAYE